MKKNKSFFKIHFQLEKLKFEMEVLNNYFSELEKVYSEKYERKVYKKILKQQKFLLPLELKVKGKEEYFRTKKVIEKEKYLKRFSLKEEVLSQKYLQLKNKKYVNKDKLDLWYYKKQQILQMKKNTYLSKLDKKYEKLILKYPPNPDLKANYLSIQEEEKIKLDSYKDKLREKVKKKLKRIKVKIDKKIDILKQKIIILEKKLKNKNKTTKFLSKSVILKIDQLALEFEKIKVIDNFSLEIKDKEIFGLIDFNDTYKMVIDCITKIYRPTKGNIYFLDKFDMEIDINSLKTYEVIKHGIARTYANVKLIWELTVLENLLVAGHTLYRTKIFDQIFHTKKFEKIEITLKLKALKILENLNLIDYKDLKPYLLPYGGLKKIELAKILMTEPKLVILDEPATNLKDEEKQELASTIKKIKNEYNCTIILFENDLSFVMDVCDRVCIISYGKKYTIGAPKEIQDNKEFINVLGINKDKLNKN